MSTEPGVDELLIRHHLRDLGVGHHPPAPEDDWWRSLYPDDDDPDGPEPAADDPDEPPAPSGRLRKISGRLPQWWERKPSDQGGHRPDAKADDPEDAPAADPEWAETKDADDPAARPAGAPRNPARAGAAEAQAVFVKLERRMQWLLSTGAGAGCGWLFHLEHYFAGWITSCGHDQGGSAGIYLGTGLVVVCGAAAYRARGWWPPLAWTCRIPFATALLALALYAPGVAP